MSSILPRLQEWYADQCDGEGEHQYGVKIETLDNPGWLVTIDLIDAAVENGVWQDAGDETQLGPLLERFLDWAEGREQRPML